MPAGNRRLLGQRQGTGLTVAQRVVWTSSSHLIYIPWEWCPLDRCLKCDKTRRYKIQFEHWKTLILNDHFSLQERIRKNLLASWKSASMVLCDENQGVFGSVEVSHMMSCLKMFIEQSIKECIGECRNSFGGVMRTQTLLEYIVCMDVERYDMILWSSYFQKSREDNIFWAF